MASPSAVDDSVQDEDVTLKTVDHDSQSSDGVKPHPQTEEILRQVEYYFSDENLPRDAHLLARTGGDGNGPTSINEILGFKKMRKFKPRAQVKAALKLSKVLEVVDDKQIKRRYPLTVPLVVKPQLADGCQDKSKTQKVLEEKPWLTEAMLRPTGFEEYATEGPLTPQEYQEDREAYDPEESLVCRMETALDRYQSKRKMHSFTRNVFIQFSSFVAFVAELPRFGSGQSGEQLDHDGKGERGQFKSGFEVAEGAVHAVEEGEANGTIVWSVDFVTTAKAFLSSRILDVADWCRPDQVKTAVNVPRNLYNFILLHDVCPEYSEQILEARRYCDVADEELPRLGELDSMLPGIFDAACSSLQDRSSPTGTGYSRGCSMKEPAATRVFIAGVKAFGTADQIKAIEEHVRQGTLPKVIRDEIIGVEVVSMHFQQHSDSCTPALSSDGSARGSDMPVPNSDDSAGGSNDSPTVRRGKLICKRWAPPHSRPKDLPASVVEANLARMSEELWFIVSEKALRLCTVGIKMEIVVKTFDNDISWIDTVIAIYPTYFTWIANEKISQGENLPPWTSSLGTAVHSRRTLGAVSDCGESNW